MRSALSNSGLGAIPQHLTTCMDCGTLAYGRGALKQLATGLLVAVLLACAREAPAESTPTVTLPTVTPTPAATATPTLPPTRTPRPLPTRRPSPTPLPDPRPHPNTLLDYAYTLAPRVVQAERSQVLEDGSRTIFVAVFERTGDPTAPYIAQGSYRGTGEAQYDSTWYSTCLRQTHPKVTDWVYYEHENWWETDPPRRNFVPAIPLISLTFEAEWRYKPNFIHDTVEAITTTVRGRGDAELTYDVYFDKKWGYILREETYMWEAANGFTPLSNTFYSYGTPQTPVVHQSEEDCLSRNAP